MTDESVRDRVAAIVQAVFGAGPEQSGHPTEDGPGEWDSLRHIEIILAVEEEFAVRITEEEFAALRSVESISAYLETLHASR